MLASWGAKVADGINSCVSELSDLRGPGALKSRREPSSEHKSHFHFKYSSEYDPEEDETTVTIGEGAVQIGGYTYFAAEDEVLNMDDGTQYVCAVVALGTGAVTFAAYASTSALNTAQSDMTKYIFPLYKVVDYKVELDYRPMPNAGCWEIAESVSNGGTSGSGTSGEGGGE